VFNISVSVERRNRVLKGSKSIFAAKDNYPKIYFTLESHLKLEQNYCRFTR